MHVIFLGLVLGCAYTIFIIIIIIIIIIIASFFHQR